MSITSILFQPFRFKKWQIQNRLAAQSMEINSASEGGAVNDVIINRYRELARGNWGIVFIEAISISEESLARENGLIINQKNLDGFKKLIKAFKSENRQTIVIFQLSHSGRMSGAFSKKIKVYEDGADIPYASTEKLMEIEQAFKRGVDLSYEAGADGIDIKACHGYLGSELLRPANTRTDEYGGSIENRSRLTSSVIEYATTNYPKLIAGSRISLYEGIRGGCGTSRPDEVIEDLNDMLAVLACFVKAGASFLNVSAGIPALTPEITRPGKHIATNIYHHFRYTSSVKKQFPNQLIVGSAYSSGAELAHLFAEENIKKGYVDMAGLGRQNLADPLYPKKLMNDKESILICQLCGGCSKLLREQHAVICTFYSKNEKKDNNL